MGHTKKKYIKKKFLKSINNCRALNSSLKEFLSENNKQKTELTEQAFHAHCNIAKQSLHKGKFIFILT
jgi:hypothetical protein